MLYVAVTSSLIALACAGELLRRSLASRRHRVLDAHATRATLRTAALAAPALRQGLRREPARRAIRHVRALLGSQAAAIVDATETLAWHGAGSEHADTALLLAESALVDARPLVDDRIACDDPRCPLRAVAVAPLTVDDAPVGALLAFDTAPSPVLADVTAEVACWISGQLQLAELDRSRAELADAELRALRLQISPHFVYNCLTTIASFVRTDPPRARGLLLDFADFARYSFRGPRNLTTLEEELHSIDRYLALERARFGSRLRVTVRVAPEVLPVKVPFLCLQPLVENAIRHGMEGGNGPGRLSLIARDAGAEAHISVEDDGVGMDPRRLRAVLAGRRPADSADSGGIGLANVDERLRNMFGDAYGLVIETEVGAGTKINLRIPKFLSE
ncbi:two-component system LytT family sensor kinase [Spinactinospora alkalitolerans]|uniref:histidine kinase n=1 Tax=Spinactinospora alkalitolerans TaxID=687207 RepID=A0A852U3L7_9ACTN|nr:histidine kinase [Spinactinospora alkalitolerans]NYE48714.1 two-component system LytT family sensor kinase [Spinactinospora alkalitolerans]